MYHSNMRMTRLVQMQPADIGSGPTRNSTDFDKTNTQLMWSLVKQNWLSVFNKYNSIILKWLAKYCFTCVTQSADLSPVFLSNNWICYFTSNTMLAIPKVSLKRKPTPLVNISAVPENNIERNKLIIFNDYYPFGYV